MQDYKSLCAAVATVPPWLTPRERHTHTFTHRLHLISLFHKSKTKSNWTLVQHPIMG